MENTPRDRPRSKAAPYYSMRMDPEEKRADIYIFGNIASDQGGLAGLLQPGSDRSSYSLVAELSAVPKDYTITVHLNTYGGEVKEALGIYNVLKERGVTTICEGFAASAGSVIFAAGRRRIMQPASLLFIHQAMLRMEGNADDFERQAEDLRTMTDAAVAAYRESGVNIPDEQLGAMLRRETWITPRDAVRMGFATGIAETGEDRDGIAVNDAMRSIMAAVTAKPNAFGTISVELDREPFEDVLRRLDEKLEQLTAAAQAMATGSLSIPQPEEKPKGFFNFNQED